MSKNRYIDTIFWRDNYVVNLDPSEKLLFLYLLTNTETTICGIYQLPIKIISVDTGFEKEMIIKILERFEKDNKIKYENGWIAIKNFIIHQNYKSPKIQTGINLELNKSPKELVKYINIPYQYSIDTVSHINTNINSNSNIKVSENSFYKEMKKKQIIEENKNLDTNIIKSVLKNQGLV